MNVEVAPTVTSTIRRDPPVFLIGVHRRCGSNFVADLLRLMPEFQLPNPISEDYLLEHAKLLVEYAERTAEEQYRKRFPDEAAFAACKAQLLGELGEGLLRFLYSFLEPEKRLLTKTPDPWGLAHFRRLFPDCLLVLLVRDGRDVVESACRSWPHEPAKTWMHSWAQNAREILAFLDGLSPDDKERTLLVRYEDLLAGREEVERLVRFVGGDPAEFPWEKLDSMPVRGSSDVRVKEGELHWKPVDKPKDFKPVGRWQSWSYWKKRQFKKIAGRELIALGYVSDDRW